MGLAAGLCQHIAPAAVLPFMDEGLGTAVPEGAADRRAFGAVGFHMVKFAMFENIQPNRLVDEDPNKFGDGPDAFAHIRL